MLHLQPSIGRRLVLRDAKVQLYFYGLPLLVEELIKAEIYVSSVVVVFLSGSIGFDEWVMGCIESSPVS